MGRGCEWSVKANLGCCNLPAGPGLSETPSPSEAQLGSSEARTSLELDFSSGA